jgi:membrane protein
MVQSTSQPSKSLVATAVGIVTLLLGASGVFGELKDALNIVWKVRAKSGLGWRPFVRQRLLSFSMVLVIGFLLLVSFLLTTLLSGFSRWVEAILRLPNWIWGGFGILLSLGVVMCLFALIFKVLPDVRIDWRHVWVGAAFTAVLFEIGKFGLAYYLGRESTASSFGAAGSVVLLLLWIYYASCILFFGAEFTKVYAGSGGLRILPTSLAEPTVPEPITGALITLPISEPARESLREVFPPAPPPSPPVSPSRFSELPEFARKNMAATLLSSVGIGLVFGLVSRVWLRDSSRRFI